MEVAKDLLARMCRAYESGKETWMAHNVTRKPEFRQVCVWEGKVVGPDGVADFGPT
jgi:hypothetical protein